MPKYRKLLRNNPYYVLKLACDSIGVKFEPAWHYQQKKHPSFPSLISYRHILSCQGIDSVLMQASLDELCALPKPIIVATSLNGGTNMVVEEIDEKSVFVRNEEGEQEPINIDFFSSYWGGDALVIDRDSKINSETKLSQKTEVLWNKVKAPLSIAAGLVIFASLLIYGSGKRDLFNYLFLALSIAGLVVSSFLVIRQFDKYNPLVNKLCHSKNGNKKIDCSSILDSEAASFKGIFSWTDFGTVFFLFYFFLLLLFPGGDTNLIASVFSILAFPYVFYSVIYQWRVAGSWCSLCLSVQLVLVLLFSVSLMWIINANYLIDGLTTSYILVAALTGITVLLGFMLLRPIVEKGLRYNALHQNYQRLRHAPFVIGYLLENEQEINTGDLQLITISPGKDDIITVIFNTTCNPCSREMNKLLEIVSRKENVTIEVIFFLDRGEEFAVRTAQYFITDYLRDTGSFPDLLKRYVSNYPASRKIIESMHLSEEEARVAMEWIDEQQKWCFNHNITSTPQLFFNHKKMPRGYKAVDIDFMSV